MTTTEDSDSLELVTLPPAAPLPVKGPPAPREELRGIAGEEASEEEPSAEVLPTPDLDSLPSSQPPSSGEEDLLPITAMFRESAPVANSSPVVERDGPAVIEFLRVNLIYPNGFHALHDISLGVTKGEFIFLVGTTGSGKSTLMKLIYKELEPSNGAVYVEGSDLADLKRAQIPFLRRRIGVIFQDFRLLLNKTAYDNVAFALEVTGTPRRHIPSRVHHALELVGLNEKAKRLPGQLSGGEQQRVAIARALVNRPPILIADEPTGNLDPDSSWDIMQTLSKVNSQDTTVLVATHNQQVVDVMRKRVLVMRKGRLEHDLERGKYYPHGGGARS